MTKKLKEQVEEIKQMKDIEKRHIAIDSLMLYVLKILGWTEFAKECEKILEDSWYS